MTTSPQYRLIDHGWKIEFENASKLKTDELLIISPFIKERALKRITVGKKKIRVITRFSLNDIQEGVSDMSALWHLLDVGAEIYGVKNLHAKMYVFGNQRAIVTSANLTEAALTRNHELGFIADDPIIIQTSRDYFERLAKLAGQAGTLNTKMLKKWETEISGIPKKKGPKNPGLGDYGADLGFMPASPSSLETTITTQAYVKFIGTGDSRSDINTTVLEEIKGSESNWALSYPNTKRPRQVKTGNVMFICRMVHSPDDYRVYGRAIAYEHQEGRDDASNADIKRCGWKDTWGTYIRTREPEFIAGTLADGVSLAAMMAELEEESFLSTAEHAKSGDEDANTDPRMALRRKAHMPLTQKAADWINSKFEDALRNHGRIPESEMKQLHWPDLP